MASPRVRGKVAVVGGVAKPSFLSKTFYAMVASERHRELNVFFDVLGNHVVNFLYVKIFILGDGLEYKMTVECRVVVKKERHVFGFPR